MVHLHFRAISGIITVLFFAGSVLASSGCSAEDESSTELSEADKRIIMGAQKMKKRKKAVLEKKAATKKKQETPSPQKKKDHGDDER